MARLEYEHYSAVVGSLESVHTQCNTPIDWQALHTRPKPTEPELPERNGQWEAGARRALQDYKPSWVDRLLGRRNVENLELSIEQAKSDDGRDHRAKIAKHQNDLQTWSAAVVGWAETRDLAASVLSGETDASVAALRGLDLWGEIADVSTSIKVTFETPDLVLFAITLEDSRVVPAEQVKLLKSGKASKKAHTKKRANEIYQDFVCGAALRIGRETFAALPFPSLVLVNVSGGLLNTSTGHHEVATLLSVALSRSRMEELNFSSLDASDSMVNFVHSMNFSPATGFKTCAPVDVAELSAT